MRPLLFAFKEEPTAEPSDFSDITYDEELNLNVYTATGQPVIAGLLLATETNTKDYGEGASDSDRSGANILMETETRTFTRTEDSDTDANRSLGTFMETMTGTRTNWEQSDSDR